MNLNKVLIIILGTIIFMLYLSKVFALAGVVCNSSSPCGCGEHLD